LEKVLSSKKVRGRHPREDRDKDGKKEVGKDTQVERRTFGGVDGERFWYDRDSWRIVTAG
jgi:hypothetical protein